MFILNLFLARTRGVKNIIEHSRVWPPTQSNRRTAVEKKRKKNEEMQHPENYNIQPVLEQ